MILKYKYTGFLRVTSLIGLLIKEWNYIRIAKKYENEYNKTLVKIYSLQRQAEELKEQYERIDSFAKTVRYSIRKDLE